MRLLPVLAAALFVLAADRPAAACERCLQLQLMQQQKAYTAQRMFGPHYAEWIADPTRNNYRPPSGPVPRGFEALENNRLRNDRMFGPGSFHNETINRMLRNMR